MLRGQRLAAVGVVFGLAAAYVGGRLVASNVFEMRAADPIILASAGATVIVITVAATMIPAIRAAREDPMRALRSE